MNTPVIILSGITPAELRALIREEVRLAVKEALDATSAAPQMTTHDLESLLNKRGSALREWLRRHPDFPSRERAASCCSTESTSAAGWRNATDDHRDTHHHDARGPVRAD